ncbi:hypothetical protein P7F88_25285 [Vibrio hannami]|uniref:hypothetical protein n=1 Tax=Vibrio hannami TaxID=2717094 RepID=UPI00240F32B9|nr:hypothetical protein [Vibrio hannami]MDG3089179.1 hypothetical protein [Vibrio hannami]
MRRLADVLAVDASCCAKRTLKDTDPKDKQLIENILREKGAALSPQNIVNGIQALNMDDGGKTRRWAKTIKPQPFKDHAKNDKHEQNE